jgi:hypothetical protein
MRQCTPGRSANDDLTDVAIKSLLDTPPGLSLQEEVSGIMGRVADGTLSPWEGEVRVMFIVKREIAGARKE